MANRNTIKNYLKESQLFTRRIVISAVLIVLGISILIGRLIYLQIFEHSLYKTLSFQNQVSLIPIEPNRGLIYDRNGVLLAENIPVYNLNIIPNRVHDLKSTINSLQKITTITPQDLERFYKELRQHRPFQPVPIKLKLTEAEVAKFFVNQFQYPGVTINAEMIRFYPLDKQLANVVGYVGRINEQEVKEIDPALYNGANYIGKIGIEKYYEKELRGVVGSEEVEVDANGRQLRVLKRIPPVPGKNIYLSIDSKLQYVVESIMANECGAIVAIKPGTGEVLALVSYPGYDPNKFVMGINPKDYKELRDSPDQPLYNRAIRGQYPFASTIKPYFAFAGLDYDVISPSFSIRDAGYYSLPNHVYHDWKKGGHGVVNLPKAITVSCDTYFYTLAAKLGIDRMVSMLERFGFGKRTGIDLLEELPGLVPNKEWRAKHLDSHWYTGYTISAGIGQGYMLATPLQLANGVSTIANRGLRYKPRLLLKYEEPDGTLVEPKPIAEKPVVLKNPKDWELIIKAMQDVVFSPMGTAKTSFGSDVPYTVAAKTGTAQLQRIKVHLYEHSRQDHLPKKLRNHKIFIAFAPVEKPEIAIAVVVENNTTAPKVARQVIDYYLLHKDPILKEDAPSYDINGQRTGAPIDMSEGVD